MKFMARGLLALSAAALLMSGVATAKDTYVKGHVKKDGTYVQGHYKTSPNRSKDDNYSSRGNTNPYTGKKGSRKTY